jgi:hypothetical protein
MKPVDGRDKRGHDEWGGAVAVPDAEPDSRATSATMTIWEGRCAAGGMTIEGNYAE